MGSSSCLPCTTPWCSRRFACSELLLCLLPLCCAARTPRTPHATLALLLLVPHTQRATPQPASHLPEEMRSDTDFALALTDEAERFTLRLRKTWQDGRQSQPGAWRKEAGDAMGAKKSRALRDNPLPWASIGAYPEEWIAALLSNYKRVTAASATADGAFSCEERARARRVLEETLLPTPLRAASIKYGGTCFGKLDTGELVGRKQALGAACAESNDPTCGGSDGGTGVTAALHRADLPPPRAHNFRASAHVYATGDCGDERQR